MNYISQDKVKYNSPYQNLNNIKRRPTTWKKETSFPLQNNKKY